PRGQTVSAGAQGYSTTSTWDNSKIDLVMGTSVVAQDGREVRPTILSSALTRNGNLLLRMVDIHCHLLPATDDGAKDWATAEAMCRMALDDGIKAVVCTPHANETYHYDRSRHMETLTELKKRVGDE